MTNVFERFFPYLVPHYNIVPVGPELVEGEDVEPRPLVPRRVQVDPHRVLLQQGGKTLVHCQVLVGLDVEELQLEKGKMS